MCEHSCAHEHGHTHEHIHDNEHMLSSIVRSALSHTVQVSVFIFLVTLVLVGILDTVGEPVLERVLRGNETLAVFVSALVGLIPNCSASVVITQLYLEGVLTLAPCLQARSSLPAWVTVVAVPHQSLGTRKHGHHRHALWHRRRVGIALCGVGALGGIELRSRVHATLQSRVPAICGAAR